MLHACICVCKHMCIREESFQIIKGKWKPLGSSKLKACFKPQNKFLVANIFRDRTPTCFSENSSNIPFSSLVYRYVYVLSLCVVFVCVYLQLCVHLTVSVCVCLFASMLYVHVQVYVFVCVVCISVPPITKLGLLESGCPSVTPLSRR